MFGETLEADLVHDAARRREFVAIIRRESQRLTHMVDNLLDAGQIERGTRRYELAPCDVVALTREALDAFSPFFERRHFTVRTALPDEAVEVRADRDAIVRALLNLFQNAVKFSGEVKEVAVSVHARDDRVDLVVGDAGVGIAPDDLPWIFEPYYRAASTRARVPGTGLGLSVVRHIASAHGGSVSAQSEPGHGSRFEIRLPRARTSTPDAPATHTDPRAGVARSGEWQAPG